MKVPFVMLFTLALIAFLAGCGESEKIDDPRPPQVDDCKIPSNTVEVTHTSETACTGAVARTLAELDAEFASISNYVYCNWSRSDLAAMRMSDKLMTLPPELGERYAKKMLATLLSYPVDHLPYPQRYRALDVMLHMREYIRWPGSDHVSSCESFILVLTRLRDAIEHARKEGNDWFTRNFIDTVSGELEPRSQFYEKWLAYRVSPKVPHQDYVHLVEELPDEKYAIIKAKFEKFLGRPIRTYEEIVRTQREHDRQMRLEEERRRGGPDVKVDVGDL